MKIIPIVFVIVIWHLTSKKKKIAPQNQINLKDNST